MKKGCVINGCVSQMWSRGMKTKPSAKSTTTTATSAVGTGSLLMSSTTGNLHCLPANATTFVYVAELHATKNNLVAAHTQTQTMMS